MKSLTLNISIDKGKFGKHIFMINLLLQTTFLIPVIFVNYSYKKGKGVVLYHKWSPMKKKIHSLITLSWMLWYYTF